LLLYSATINAFTGKVKKLARIIMNEEMGMAFNKTRFLWRGYYYPLHFVLFEDPTKLGYFSPGNFQLGLHKRLMYLAHDEVLQNIIRHELAHMDCSLIYGKQANIFSPHGNEFRKICTDFGWGPEVYKAYANLKFENHLYSSDANFEKVKLKVEKLLALAASDNPHEAQAATLKANDLLLKYNLKNLEYNDEIETCVTMVFHAKKMNSTLNALYEILQYFYVQPVFNRNREGVSLDVVGTRLNVEMADYIAKYLASQFGLLWDKIKKDDPSMKGLKKKNNYILGIAAGFTQKLKNERNLIKKGDYSARDLMVMEQNLVQQVKLAFPRLSRQSGSAGSFDHNARTKGQQAGNALSIHPGVSQGNQGHLLS